MPDRRLTAYLHGRRAGWFSQTDGRISFEFDREWAQSSRRMELTASMPTSQTTHRGPHPENYLWGLLPDNTGVLERWGRRFSANPRNPMALLAHVGLDTAGAIQLTEHDSASLAVPASLKPISRGDIAGQLHLLRVDPDAWMLSADASGSFSLAGAQAKFALTKTNDGWAVPVGSAASTHIFKPGVRGFTRQDINEHLCLNASIRLGMNTARSEVVDFDGESAIVVERFDRRLEGGAITRIHQEDLLQAAGYHPQLKYQNDGGPGITECAAILRNNVIRSTATDAVDRFFDANVFNWVISGTDAHAKNYSMLHTDNGATFAPLYDVASSLPYPELAPRKVKLAMAVMGHYRVWEVTEERLVRQAEQISIDPRAAQHRIREMLTDAPAAFAEAAEHSGLSGADYAFARDLADRVAARTSDLLARPRPSAFDVQSRTTKTTRRRAKDLGRPGNGGRFA